MTHDIITAVVYVGAGCIIASAAYGVHLFGKYVKYPYTPDALLRRSLWLRAPLYTIVLLCTIAESMNAIVSSIS